MDVSQEALRRDRSGQKREPGYKIWTALFAALASLVELDVGLGIQVWILEPIQTAALGRLALQSKFTRCEIERHLVLQADSFSSQTCANDLMQGLF